MRLMGLDVGTTGCKASLFDERGALLASASREYPVNIPQPGWAEQDAERVWLLAQEAIRQVLSSTGVSRLDALGLSVQGEAVMPVDDAGTALRPAILGMDTRTSAQNEWLVRRFGPSYLFQHTGMPIHTINTLPKLLWLKEHEPHIWSKAAYFRLYEDFLLHKLTGRALISQNLASRTQLYDLLENNWSAEILDVLELDAGRLSPVVPSGTAVGEMVPELAARLGLKNQPLVSTGGHDQACGALGVGLVQPGLSMVSTGTAEVVEVALSSLALNEALQHSNISVYVHVVPDMYLAMTLNHSGGLILRWFRDTFCVDEKARATAEGSDAYDLILHEASPEPTSLLLLPHFSGSGTPLFDLDSKGAILGLSFATTRTDMAKAILEGLTFELRYNLEVLYRAGVRIDELRAIGGGARSDLWLQLKADVTGIPVVAPQITEAASWGAALLSGHAAGIFPDTAAAAQAALNLDRRFEPHPDRSRRYTERYALYRELYPALAPLLHRLG